MVCRNDITIAIVRLNQKVVLRTAQGSVQNDIGNGGDIIHQESLLYYSQIRYRSAVFHDTNFYIMTSAFARRHYSQSHEKVVSFPLPIGGGKIAEVIMELIE